MLGKLERIVWDGSFYVAVVFVWLLMAAQATGSTGECLSGYSGSSKSVPGAMTTTPVESSPTAKRPRFSFESDTLALKSNPE